MFYIDGGHYTLAGASYDAGRDYFIANPIFDIAPTKIEVTTKDTDYDVSADTIWLNYYNFTSSSSGVITNKDLEELFDEYNVTNSSLQELFSFNITPKVKARLKVSEYRIPRSHTGRPPLPPCQPQP